MLGTIRGRVKGLTLETSFQLFTAVNLLHVANYCPSRQHNTVVSIAADPSRNISNTSDSVSSGYPNTEKRVENTTRSGVFLTKFEVFG